MSGRQRNIRRQRATLSFDDDEGEEAQDEGPVALPPAAKAAAAAAAAKREKQRAAQKKATLLSFEDDAGDGEEGGAAAKAKATRPKGVMRAPDAAAPPPAADERAARVYTQMSAAGAPTWISAPAAARASCCSASQLGLRAALGQDCGASCVQPACTCRAQLLPPLSVASLQRAAHSLPQPAGEYTVEKLKELQKNARSAPSSKPAYKPVAAGGGFKLSGSFKAAAPPKDDRFQYNVNAAGVVRPQGEQPARGAGSAGGGDMPLPPPSEPPPPADGDKAQQGAAPTAATAPGPAAADDDGEEPDIPDEEMIAWAKAKRERLRGAHLAPDYIPTAAAPPGLSRCVLAGAAGPAAVRAWRHKRGGLQKRGCTPRLLCAVLLCRAGGSGTVRQPGPTAARHRPPPLPAPHACPPCCRLRDKKKAEEAVVAGSASESETEAEADLRMKFAAGPAGVSGGGSGRGGRRGGAAAAEDDGGEEDEQWAQEQIRKGMGGLLPPGRGGSSAALAAEGEAVAAGDGAASRGTAAALAAGGGSQAAAIQAAADEVLRTLQAGLHRLQMSRQQAEKNLEKTSASLQVGVPPCCTLPAHAEARWPAGLAPQRPGDAAEAMDAALSTPPTVVAVWSPSSP